MLWDLSTEIPSQHGIIWSISGTPRNPRRGEAYHGYSKRVGPDHSIYSSVVFRNRPTHGFRKGTLKSQKVLFPCFVCAYAEGGWRTRQSWSSLFSHKYSFWLGAWDTIAPARQIFNTASSPSMTVLIVLLIDWVSDVISRLSTPPAQRLLKMVGIHLSCPAASMVFTLAEPHYSITDLPSHRHVITSNSCKSEVVNLNR